MSKPRYKTNNWKQYNQALINRGRPRVFSDLMIKRIFSMPLRASQGFIDSVFRLAQVPLSCPHYSCISRRAKDVDVSFKTKGPIQHLAIDATGLKVYGEGEWKVKKHGTDGKRRVWRKLHLAVDTNTHEIIAAELSLSTVTDAEVLPNLLKQTRRKILEISGDGAYDTRDCHNAIYIKRSVALIPPREGGSILGTRPPKKLSGWLSEVIRLEQVLERAIWLSQAVTIRNSNVSCEAVTWWSVKSKKLQRTSW